MFQMYRKYNLDDGEFEPWVDDYIKRNVLQRVEFGLEHVVNSITYNMSIPDPKPMV